MVELKDYLNYDLFPALYDSLDNDGVLAEFGFKKVGKYYQSTTKLKADGREGNKAGQVLVYANNQTNFIDHSETEIQYSIIDYVRYHSTGNDIGFLPAVNTLAKMAGVKPFKIEMTEGQKAEFEAYLFRCKIWQSVIDFCLQQRDAPTPEDKNEALNVHAYLTKQRSYTADDVRHMQLGFLPSQEKLFRYLKEKDFTEEDIRKVIKLNLIGFDGFKLIIPLKDYTGKYVGIAARDIRYTGGPDKYRYSTGYKKGESLYNLSGKARNGRVLIVEGQLDAGIAASRGFDYATPCAIGGKHLSPQQTQQLAKAKVAEAYLCLDNEKETIPNIIKAIEALQTVESIEDKIFIVALPEGVKDVDLLVTTKGIEQLTEVVKKAEAFWFYLAHDVSSKFRAVAKIEDCITAHNELQFIEDLQGIAQRIKNPVNRQRYYNFVIAHLKDWDIDVTDESFKDAVDRLQYKAEQAEQNEALQKLLKKAEATRAAGKTKEAIEQVEAQIREVKLKDKTTEFKALLSEDQSESGVRSRSQNKPENVKIGYKIDVEEGSEEIELPAGGLTLIAGATGHGKTAAIINISLNIITRTQKNVYVFTYEEDKDIVIGYALNTYVNKEVSKTPKSSINHFLKTGLTTFIRKDVIADFLSKKDEFFKIYLEPGRLKIMYVDYSADELISLVHHIRSTDPEAVILVDYIQRMRSDRAGNVSARYTELKFISEDLNRCAIDTGLPIVLGAQFNRDVKNPLLMHPTRISEASDIEKNASEIFGLWNCVKKMDGDSKQITEAKTFYGLSNSPVHVPEPYIILQILKSRNLPADIYSKLTWNGKTKKIENQPSFYDSNDGF